MSGDGKETKRQGLREKPAAKQRRRTQAASAFLLPPKVYVHLCAEVLGGVRRCALEYLLQLVHVPAKQDGAI